MIAKLPRDGVKCISKLQSHCVNINFSDKSRYDRIFQKVTPNGEESAITYIKKFQNVQALSVSVGNVYSEDYPEPRNFPEVTRLSEGTKKTWFKENLKYIKNLFNNQTFLVQDPGKDDPLTACIDIYKSTF